MYICVICPISKQKNKDTPYICQGLSPQINPKKALTQISLMGFIWTHVGGIFISYFPQKQKGSITEGTCEYWKIQLWLNCVSLHTPNDQAIQ